MDQTQEFLQSEDWVRFQGATSKEVLRFSSDDFLANGVVHRLPFVGKYLYIPRGPIFENTKYQIPNIKEGISRLVEEAKKRKAKWIRIDPENEEVLEAVEQAFDGSVVRAPHDMQPKEIFVMDITRDAEALFAEMKSKTRYNIRLAEKHGVKVFSTREEKYQQAFLDLIQATALRKEISPHPKEHYVKFFEVFPPEMCQLFVAEYQGKILVANIIIIFGTRAIYLHGGSASVHRDVMAPFLLQWEQIRYAKERGCTEYDFGGIKTESSQQSTNNKSDWNGITRFKTGFSPNTKPVVFPGSYDMILDSKSYFFYNLLRQFQEMIRSMNIFR